MLLHVVMIHIVLISTGFGVQEIVLNVSPCLSPCKEGLRSGIDNYFITGTVGPRFTYYTGSGWNKAVVVQVLTQTSSHFVEMCKVFIGDNGQDCKPNSTDMCFCDQLDTHTGLAHIVITSSAPLNYSNAIVRGVWLHRNKSLIYSAKNVTLPHIYDVTSAVLEFKVNRHLAGRTFQSFDVSFKAFAVNNFVLCCFNMVSPCYPKIIFNGIVVAENKPTCASYTSPSMLGYADINMSYTYSVCSMTDYKVYGTVILKPDRPIVVNNGISAMRILFWIMLEIMLFMIIILIACFIKMEYIN